MSAEPGATVGKQGRGRALTLALWCLVLATAGVVVATRTHVTTSITHFLAPGTDRRAAEISARLARSELSRTVVVLVEASAPGDGGPAASRAAADFMATRLEADPRVAWVRTGVPEAQREAVFELYFPRRWLFTVPFSARPHGVEAGPRAFVDRETADDRLDELATELRADLAGPRGPLVKRLAPEDPWSLFTRRASQLRDAAGGGLKSREGGLVTAAGAAVIVLASRDSAFDADSQRALQAALEAARDAAAHELGGPVSLAQSGVGRFAIRAETAIRRDITRISTLGTLAVVALFVAVFRSLRLMLLSMVPLGAGVVCAAAITSLLYGEIHGLTLAFGATLVGICIDYPAHLLSHLAAAWSSSGPETAAGGGSAASRALGEVRPGLLLGAGTTIVGFGGLGWTSFPGIREIATFAVSGLVVALAATLTLLPPLLPTAGYSGGAHARLRALAGRLWAAMQRRRIAVWVPAALAVLVCAAGLGRVRFTDDPRALTRIDAALLAEDERVRAAVSRMEAGQIVLASGVDDETALAANDAAHRELELARREGALEDFRSLHPWLTAAARQRAVAAAWTEAATGDLRERFDARFGEAGFRTETFDPAFAAMRAAQAQAPLTVDDLRDAGLEDLVGTFRVGPGETSGDEGEVTYLSYVRGVADPSAFGARLAQLPGVQFFDQQAVLRAAYASHRRQGIELVGAGLVAVFLVLLLRYRHGWTALAAFVPSVVAAATTLSTLALLGVELHLLHLISALLVLSMGVDYGVFLAETSSDEGRSTTLVSLLVACLSTVFAFGLLGLSANPALRAVGLTSGLGVAWSLVLAPSLNSLLPPRKRSVTA